MTSQPTEMQKGELEIAPKECHHPTQPIRTWICWLAFHITGLKVSQTENVAPRFDLHMVDRQTEILICVTNPKSDIYLPAIWYLGNHALLVYVMQIH